MCSRIFNSSTGLSPSEESAVRIFKATCVFILSARSEAMMSWSHENLLRIFGEPNGGVEAETELPLHSVPVSVDLFQQHGMITSMAVSGGVFFHMRSDCGLSG